VAIKRSKHAGPETTHRREKQKKHAFNPEKEGKVIEHTIPGTTDQNEGILRGAGQKGKSAQRQSGKKSDAPHAGSDCKTTRP